MSAPVTPGPQNPAAAMAEPPLSEAGRIVNVFAAPAKTFADLRRRPTWFVPWLLLAIAQVVLAFVIGQRVGFERLGPAAIENSPRAAQQMEKLPAADRERRMALVSKSIQATFYASPIILLVTAIIVAAVLMGIFNTMAADKIGFRTSMGVTLYSFLPKLIAIAILLLSLYLGDPEGFKLENPTATNLGALLDPATTPKFLYVLAKALDIFSIWVILLMGIGYATVGRLRRATTWGILFGLFFLITLIGAGWAQLFS